MRGSKSFEIPRTSTVKNQVLPVSKNISHQFRHFCVRYLSELKSTVNWKLVRSYYLNLERFLFKSESMMGFTQSYICVLKFWTKFESSVSKSVKLCMVDCAYMYKSCFTTTLQREVRTWLRSLKWRRFLFK